MNWGPGEQHRFSFPCPPKYLPKPRAMKEQLENLGKDRNSVSGLKSALGIISNVVNLLTFGFFPYKIGEIVSIPQGYQVH